MNYITLFDNGFLRLDEIMNKEVLDFINLHHILPRPPSRDYLYKTYLTQHGRIRMLCLGVAAFADFSCEARIVGTAFYLLTPAVWHTPSEFSALSETYEMFLNDLGKEKKIEIC